MATKNPNEPSPVATPMSIPFICRTATTQDATASPSVAVSTAAVVALLTLVMQKLQRFLHQIASLVPVICCVIALNLLPLQAVHPSLPPGHSGRAALASDPARRADRRAGPPTGRAVNATPQASGERTRGPIRGRCG